MKIKSELELSKREATFVTRLCEGHPVTTAARLVSYSPGHAKELVARPRIQAALRGIAANVSKHIAE